MVWKYGEVTVTVRLLRVAARPLKAEIVAIIDDWTYPSELHGQSDSDCRCHHLDLGEPFPRTTGQYPSLVLHAIVPPGSDDSWSNALQGAATKVTASGYVQRVLSEGGAQWS